MAAPRRPALLLIVLFTCLIARPAHTLDIDSLLKMMRAAYLEVRDYRVLVEVERRTRGEITRKEEFRYFFKRPDRVRIDYVEPYGGTIAVYPDKKGKVLVKPWGMFALHLSPESFLLRNPSGQRIDQTDLGSLISNISRSVGESRRGPLSLEEGGDRVRIKVLAEDHFRPGVLTDYEFLIDKRTWLPTEIRERSAQGALERVIRFRNLVLNEGLAESLFELEGEKR